MEEAHAPDHGDVTILHRPVKGGTLGLVDLIVSLRVGREDVDLLVRVLLGALGRLHGGQVRRVRRVEMFACGARGVLYVVEAYLHEFDAANSGL